MEDLLVLKENPTPIPYNSQRFLCNESFLIVTPEKSLSSKLFPVTQSLKDSSFLSDINDGNRNDSRAKVQFNKSVSVFQFSPDQTSNTDESLVEDSSRNLQSSNLSNSQSPSYIASKSGELFQRIRNLNTQLHKLDSDIDLNFSNSCQLSCTDSYNHNFSRQPYKIYDSKSYQSLSENVEESDPDDDWSSSFDKGVVNKDSQSNAGARSTSLIGENGESLLDDFCPIITDIHSFGDEVAWESDGDNDDRPSNENIIDMNKYCKNETHTASIQTKPNPSVTSHNTCISESTNDGAHNKAKSELATNKNSHKEKDVRAETNHVPCKKIEPNVNKTNEKQIKKSCLKNTDKGVIGSCPLADPVINSTLKLSHDLEKLKMQDFKRTVLKKGKLTNSKIQANIEEKALTKLNVTEHCHYVDLVDIDVKEDDICKRVVQEKLSKVKREKHLKTEERITRVPDVMDFYDEKLFTNESANQSVPSLPFLLSCSSSLSTSSQLPSDGNKQFFKPKVKAVDLNKAFDLYKHIRIWEGLS